MSREILFRGKTFNGEWVFGSFMAWYFEGQYNKEKPITPTIFWIENGRQHRSAVIPETVGQFTGLLDKNGKKIFEGDVVKRIFVDDGLEEVTQILEVYWGRWCWMRKKVNGIGFSFDSIEARDSEVIGNIHDNPELLEQTK